MNIRIIAAVGQNFELGKNNSLLWDLPDDLQYFRRITKEKPVIMGRKTYQSIGRPLPQRTNVVVTRNSDFHAEGCIIVSSFEKALEIAEAENAKEICIIGGAQIYEQALPIATHLNITFVQASFDADTFFPTVEWKNWQEVSREHHAADKRHAYEFEFVELEKK